MEVCVEQWFKCKELKGKNMRTLLHRKKRQDWVIFRHEEQVIREEGRGRADEKGSSLS